MTTANHHPMKRPHARNPLPAKANERQPRGGLFAIMTKELKRVFTDPRMVLTIVLLPGLMVFVIYFFMGEAMSNFLRVDEDYRMKAYAVNLPTSFESLCEQAGLEFESINADEADGIKTGIVDKELDLLVVFPTGFEADIASILAGSPSGAIPDVQIYFNATRTESNSAYGLVIGLFDAYKNASLPLFTINADNEGFNLATDEDITGLIFSNLLPLLIIVFLFTGAQSIAVESIAGEKERGTFATLLITPLKRWELALGKIIGMGIVALSSGISSFIGIMLSLPRILGVESETAVALSYGFADYAFLLFIVLSTVLLFVGIISILSTFAKTVKEATTLVMPLMIVVMLIGVSGMFSQTAQSDLWLYLIPLYNSVQCLGGVFSFGAEPLHVAIAVCTNVLATAICVFALTKMFNSEKVMFAR